MQVPSFHLPRTAVTFGWSRDHRPLLTVPSGAEIVVDADECSHGQVLPGATKAIIRNLDFERVDLASGPVYVEGARAGDTLQVDILEMKVGAYGWSANHPGYGLLTEEYPDEWLYVWDLTTGPAAQYVRGIAVPIEPMAGVVGVAPAEPGIHDPIPPRRTGGNMDIKHVGPGTTLYLPVEVDGALFGVGDPHAAQGDGEVAGSGIEAPMQITVRLTVRRDIALETPEYIVRRPLERPSAAAAGYHVTTGVGPDLLEEAKNAIRRMIRRLGHDHGLDPMEAYMLCSVACDLKISEIVDNPNYIVSAFLPNDLFPERR
jgi:acetamidase/formamidase